MSADSLVDVRYCGYAHIHDDDLNLPTMQNMYEPVIASTMQVKFLAPQHIFSDEFKPYKRVGSPMTEPNFRILPCCAGDPRRESAEILASYCVCSWCGAYMICLLLDGRFHIPAWDMYVVIDERAPEWTRDPLSAIRYARGEIEAHEVHTRCVNRTIAPLPGAKGLRQSGESTIPAFEYEVVKTGLGDVFAEPSFKSRVRRRTSIKVTLAQLNTVLRNDGRPAHGHSWWTQLRRDFREGFHHLEKFKDRIETIAKKGEDWFWSQAEQPFTHPVTLAHDGSDPVTLKSGIWEEYLIKVPDNEHPGEFKWVLPPVLTPIEFFGIDPREPQAYERLMASPSFDGGAMSEYRVRMMLAVYKAHKRYAERQTQPEGLYVINRSLVTPDKALQLDREVDEYMFWEVFGTTLDQPPLETNPIVRQIILKGPAPTAAVQKWCENAIALLKSMYAVPNKLWRGCDAVAIYRHTRVAVYSAAKATRERYIPDVVTKNPHPGLGGSDPPMTSFLPTVSIGENIRVNPPRPIAKTQTLASGAHGSGATGSSTDSSVLHRATIPQTMSPAEVAESSIPSSSSPAVVWSHRLGDNRNLRRTVPAHITRQADQQQRGNCLEVRDAGPSPIIEDDQSDWGQPNWTRWSWTGADYQHSNSSGDVCWSALH